MQGTGRLRGHRVTALALADAGSGHRDVVEPQPRALEPLLPLDPSHDVVGLEQELRFPGTLHLIFVTAGEALEGEAELSDLLTLRVGMVEPKPFVTDK